MKVKCKECGYVLGYSRPDGAVEIREAANIRGRLLAVVRADSVLHCSCGTSVYVARATSRSNNLRPALV